MSKSIKDIKLAIKNGEDSYTQLKEKITRAESLASELVAFLNSYGGAIIVGVSDKKQIVGLRDKEIESLNQLISNVSSQNIKPPAYPTTQILTIDDKKIIVISVKEGFDKPYSTSSGFYYAKAGADKRKISPEELKRLFAQSKKLYADEEIVYKTSIKDINLEFFYRYLEKTNQKIYEELKEGELALTNTLENFDLLNNGCLTLAGNLIFGLNPQKFNKSFYVDCVYFDGLDVSTDKYNSKDKLEGSFNELFKQSLSFLKSNLKKNQGNKNFNEGVTLEIPEEVLVELIANALVHRDYYINSSIKIFIFLDRIEIINPGKLPNNLTVEKIKSGISVHRNPILNSLAKNILPYSGYGSGIRRALKIYPDIEFINDTEKEEFKAIIKRR